MTTLLADSGGLAQFRRVCLLPRFQYDAIGAEEDIDGFGTGHLRRYEHHAVSAAVTGRCTFGRALSAHRLPLHVGGSAVASLSHQRLWDKALAGDVRSWAVTLRLANKFGVRKGATSNFKRGQWGWKGTSTHSPKRTYCEQRTDRVHWLHQSIPAVSEGPEPRVVGGSILRP